MRLTSTLILALASVFALHLPTASAADFFESEFPAQPVKQALAKTTEVVMPAPLQPIADIPGVQANDIAGAKADEGPSVAAPEVPADLWGRIRSGFTMQELDTPLVQSHVAWYANRPDYMQRMIERSQLYLYHIVEEVEKRGMPTEIALLPMIESAFNPKALSTSRASGIWQFIPSTGKDFGLKQNWWYDGRRDVTAATDAALDYLQKLHDMFGSWELALAAYNWGEGSVQRAIAKNQKMGLPTDYLSLTMPAETRNYLPKLMAVKQIVMNPEANGLTLASIPNRPYFVTVTTTQHIDVAVAARLAEMPLQEFVSLNPAHNRPVINAKGAHTLLLPVDKAEIFARNLESYDKPLVSWKSHTLKRGEKIDTLARRFSISVAQLKEVNGITKRQRLSAGQSLLVPLSSDEASAFVINDEQKALEPDEPLSGARKVHIVKRGETLASIAKRYRVSAAQLKSLNRLSSMHVANGQRLVIRRTASKRVALVGKGKAARTSAAKQPSYYTVRPGDTVASIARRFNVAINDIQRWNTFVAKRGLTPGNKVTLMLPAKG